MMTISDYWTGQRYQVKIQFHTRRARTLQKPDSSVPLLLSSHLDTSSFIIFLTFTIEPETSFFLFHIERTLLNKYHTYQDNTFSVYDEHCWCFIEQLADILHWRVKFEIFNALPNKQQKPQYQICDDFLSFTLFYEGFSPHYFVLWSYYVVKLLMRNSMLLFLCS